MKSGIAFGLIGLGFLLLILSGFWTSLFPGTSMWTPEKAERQSTLHHRLHNLAFIVGSSQSPSMHRGSDAGKAKQEYDELKKESDALDAEFQTAHDRPKTTARILKWTGISLAIIGLIGWYAVSQTS